MDFDRPAALVLLLPLALLVLAGAWRSRAALPRGRLRWATGARLATGLLAVAALAGPRLPLGPVPHRPAVFAVDVSDSVPLPARESALRQIARLAREAPPDTEQWVVAFAGRAVARRIADPARVEEDPSIRELLLFPSAEAAARRDMERGTVSPSPPGSAERAPETEASLRRIAELRQSLEPGETDLQSAVRALGGLPASGHGPALVLFTDGRLTRPFGPEGWAALRASAGSILLADTGGVDPGIVVEAVSAPPFVDAGQPFDAVVRFRARGGESARIRLLIDDRPEGDTPHACVPGTNVATLTRRASEDPGLHRLKVIVEAEGDPEPRNNVGIALVHVGTPPEILLVEGRRGLAAHLEGALQVQGIRTERVEAARLPDQREALARFSAVGLIGVAADQVSDAATAALRDAAENGGIGILFAAGPHLAGTKSWRGHPAERLLPVAFDAYDPPPPTGSGPPAAPPDTTPPAPTPAATPKPATVEASAITLCLLIDKSGSMAGDNIRLAREAAIAAADTLENGDLVVVIAFDVEPRLVLEPTPAGKKDFIRDRIARIQADGGTHVYPALSAAYRLLRNEASQARHVIVMSDGITQVADYRGLLNQMRADRITVSSVCVASDLTFDWTLMHNLAVWGGGRFYPALSFKEVPQIFTKETRVLVDVRAKERTAREQREKAQADARRPRTPPPVEPPKPAPSSPATPPEIPLSVLSEEEPVKGLAKVPLPPVGGLLPATARQATVTCVACTNDQRPALVIGRAGLGHTAVWLAEWADDWGRRWLSWDRFPAFAAQLVRSLFRRGQADPFPGTVSAEIRGGEAHVRIDFSEAAAKRDGRYTTQATWRREGGPEHPIPLRQVSPFVVEGSFPATTSGEPLIVLARLADGARSWIAPPVGLSRAYPEELASGMFPSFFGAGEAGLPPPIPLEAVELPPAPSSSRGRRSVPVSAPLLAAALLLLPVDIALRRLRL